MPMKAVIFDMDGVLIDTEPIWQEVESNIFGSCGVPLSLKDCEQTIGMRIDEVVAYWYKKLPWQGKKCAQVVQEIHDEMVRQIPVKGKPLVGALEALDEVKKLGFSVALASSSSLEIITTVLKTLGRDNFFDVVYSAEFESHGKPHPAVYLTTAQKLGFDPQDCIAVEDSVNGMLAAKSAKMKCIAVPHFERRNNKEFGIADVVLDSLNQFNKDILEVL